MRGTTTLSGEDAAWLHMETDDNLMVVCGFIELATPITRSQLEEVIRRRLLVIERFTQRVVEPVTHLGAPRWEADPNFDLIHHLVDLEPAPRDERELQEVLAKLVSEPLDRSRPLWRMHFVPRYGAGSLLIVRTHHCVADGFAQLHVLLALCDAGPSRIAVPEPSVSALREATQALREPWHVGALLAKGADFTASLAHLVASPVDPPTPLKGPLAVPKRVAWTPSLPLPALKQLAARLEVTINDVLVACVAGSLRRYLALRRSDPNVQLHAMVPVNLRSREEALTELGNRFGLLIFPLPVDVADPVERLAKVKARMDEAKRSPDAVVSMGLLWGMGLVPVPLERLLVAFFAPKASLVLTNVPGPRTRVRLGGSEVSRLMFWVPQSGRLGVGISLVSYAGSVVVGVMTDAALVPDPQEVVAGFVEELAALG
jgi:WS/DGAT/MGAT family acyltransferase